MDLCIQSLQYLVPVVVNSYSPQDLLKTANKQAKKNRSDLLLSKCTVMIIFLVAFILIKNSEKTSYLDSSEP